MKTLMGRAAMLEYADGVPPQQPGAHWHYRLFDHFKKEVHLLSEYICGDNGMWIRRCGLSPSITPAAEASSTEQEVSHERQELTRRDSESLMRVTEWRWRPLESDSVEERYPKKRRKLHRSACIKLRPNSRKRVYSISAREANFLARNRSFMSEPAVSLCSAARVVD